MDAVTLSQESGLEQLEKALATALTEGALPGETEGLDTEAAAGFIAKAAARRQSGKAALAIASIVGGTGEARWMRLAIINDDMPFLVGSVAGAIGAHGIGIDRLLHPVLSVRRDENGDLLAI